MRFNKIDKRNMQNNIFKINNFMNVHANGQNVNEIVFEVPMNAILL